MRLESYDVAGNRLGNEVLAPNAALSVYSPTRQLYPVPNYQLEMDSVAVIFNEERVLGFKSCPFTEWAGCSGIFGYDFYQFVPRDLGGSYTYTFTEADYASAPEIE